MLLYLFFFFPAAIANVSTLGMVVDLVCLIVTLLALYGVRKVSKKIFHLYSIACIENNVLYIHTTSTTALEFWFLCNLPPPYICTHVVVANKMLNWQHVPLYPVYIFILFLALDTLNGEV